MAESSWPGEAPTVVAEAAFEQLSSGWFASGLVGNVSDQSLVFADSTGMHVKLRPDRYAKVRGFTWWSGESTVQLPIASNTSGSTRVDRVVLRLDRSDWTVRAVVKQGTPGGGAPGLTVDDGDTGVWEFAIADVTLPNGTTATITSGMVEARDNFLGGQLLVTKAGTLLNPNVPEVFLRYHQGNDQLILHREHSSSSGQVSLWDHSGEVSLSTTNSNWACEVTPVMRKINNVVELRYGSARRTAGSTLSVNSESRLPGLVPSSMRHPTRDQYAVARTTGHDAARVVIGRGNGPNAGHIRLTEHGGLSSGQYVTGFTVLWLVP